MSAASTDIDTAQCMRPRRLLGLAAAFAWLAIVIALRWLAGDDLWTFNPISLICAGYAGWVARRGFSP